MRDQNNYFEDSENQLLKVVFLAQFEPNDGLFQKVNNAVLTRKKPFDELVNENKIR